MNPFPRSETPMAELNANGPEPVGSPLTNRVRAGVSWNVSSALLTEFSRLGRSIVLARLLVPEDFGLFGMALTIVAAVNALTALGLDRTIIASKFESEAELETHLNTVWSTELVRSLTIALLVTASAYPIARFYGQPQLKVIIPILGAISFVQGFQNVGLTLLRKQIRFARIFWFELCTNITGIVLTIALALVMRNVWALVIGLLLTACLSTTLSYVFHPYRPRLAFEKTAVRRAVHLGKSAFVIAVASYVTTMADNVMIGRLLGPGALGNYSLAYNIASTPISVLVFAFGTVLFPAYAEISDKPKRLEQAFTKVFGISLLILLTTTVFLYLLAGETIQLLFGGRWANAGKVLPLLALIIPFRGLTIIVSTLFLALNKPGQVAIGKTLEAIIFVSILYPLVNSFGLVGAAGAGLIAYGISFVTRIHALEALIPGITPKLVRISVLTMIAAGSGFFVAAFCLGLLSAPLPRLVCGGLLTSAIPSGILLLIRRDFRKTVVQWFSSK